MKQSIWGVIDEFGVPVCLALALAVTSACSFASPAPPAAAVKTDICSTPETGIISPESPGLVEKKLEGPFLLKSLTVIVDPANPDPNGSVVWTRNNNKDSDWFKIGEFKGEFFIAEGEFLGSQMRLSPWKTVYSGCRIE